MAADAMLNMSYYYDTLSGYHGMPFWLDIILRILASLVAGAIVGYERKKRAKEAGIRTHCMVAMGAAIFAIVSKYGFFDVVSFESVTSDAGRIAANIVTGVCFLGAGMIFIKNKSISGLTTAAGIWAVSAIGLAFGVGLYSLGGLGTILIFLIHYVLHKPLIAIEGASAREITCIVENWDAIAKLDDVIKAIDRNSYFSCVEKKPDETVLVKFVVRVEHNEIVDDIYKFMSSHPYIKSMSN